MNYQFFIKVTFGKMKSPAFFFLSKSIALTIVSLQLEEEKAFISCNFPLKHWHTKRSSLDRWEISMS